MTPGRPFVLANGSDIDLDRQVTAPGATWLDYRLVERERMPLAVSGFGKRCAIPDGAGGASRGGTELTSKLIQQGVYPDGTCGSAFATRLKKDYEFYGRVISEEKIGVE